MIILTCGVAVVVTLLTMVFIQKNLLAGLIFGVLGCAAVALLNQIAF